jgi:hypothetical protein
MNKVAKSRQKFFCQQCDYTCSKQSDYNKHILTRKHQSATNGNNVSTKYSCDVCCREYKDRSGLWRHKKTCGIISNPESEASIHVVHENDLSTTMNTDVIVELLKQNQEFKMLLVEQQEENKLLQNQLLEVVKEGKTINNTNCNTTNNNKFNLNFFLNEQCKDAMNISDFINNMVLTIDDLKNTGKLGYIDGITKIFTDKLRELDTHNRPMHCTDLKRETLYIKNNNEWNKETDDKQKIKTAIECVANKNLNNLDNWKEENPNHEIMDSKEDKEFVEIMTNSLGGMGSDREKNKQKIIRNVLKEVIVEKGDF